MRYKFFFLLVIFFLFFKLGIQLLSLGNIFTRNYHIKYQHLYSNYYTSQYVQKVNPNIIPDNALEAFAGGVFLKGLNPILIVHDQPPLGRYIISLSILIFDNAGTIPVFLYIASLLGLLLISRRILKNTIISLLPIGLFVNDKLYLNGFSIYPTLEQIQFPFIIFSLYFFIKGVEEKKYIKWFILSFVMLGFVISIRFFSLGVALVASMISYLILKEKLNKKTFYFFLTFPLSIIVLLLSYTKTIISGHSILHIFGIQKYMLLYHQSKFILPFTFWDLLMFNRWHTWWGDKTIAKDPTWSILWPISAILTLFSIIGYLIKMIKTSISEKVLIFWIIWYMAFLSIGYSSTRYFLPLIPFLYIVGFSFAYNLFNVIKKYCAKK